MIRDQAAYNKIETGATGFGTYRRFLRSTPCLCLPTVDGRGEVSAVLNSCNECPFRFKALYDFGAGRQKNRRIALVGRQASH
jgi:hypothetical protein